MSRRAFGLPQALLIILFIGGIVTVTMRYVSLGAKHYADSFTREQAELFLQSSTEAALLAISGHDRSTGCLNELNITSPDGRFYAEVTILKYYFSDGSTCTGGLSEPIESEESNGMVDMRITVTSNTTDLTKKVGSPVKLIRRSLQRP